MPIDALYSSWQSLLVGVCTTGLLLIAVISLIPQVAPILDRIWSQWLRLDGFGKCAVSVFVIGIVLYGGSKNAAWNRVQNDGADANIGLVGVFTQISNDVQTVEGVTTTNQIPLLAVMWTNGTVTASTPVSYRASNTNDWSEIQPVSSSASAEGTTNILVHVLSQELKYPFWWVGVDKPAVIVTSTDIKISRFVETSTFIRIEWTCEQPKATTFDIYCKKLTDATWTYVTQTSNKYVQCGGFYVDKSLEWKVTSTYLEDGE